MSFWPGHNVASAWCRLGAKWASHLTLFAVADRRGGLERQAGGTLAVPARSLPAVPLAAIGLQCARST